MAKILVIGATSAIAIEMARIWARRGDRLFVVARDARKLAAVVDELGEAVVGSSSADLDDTHGNAARVQQAIAELGGVDVALLAHGVLGDQAETEREWAAAEAVLRTNLLSMVSLLIPIANAMADAGAGRIGVMSSVAGERGRPRNFTYGAAKGGLTIYLQGLRSRLWKSGVSVHTFKLGPVDTPMTATHRKNAVFARAPAVAATMVAHLDRNGGPAYVPWFWAPIMFVVRRMPEAIFQRLGFLSDR